jgi:glycerol kinase
MDAPASAEEAECSVSEKHYVLALDEGTSSVRAMIVDRAGQIIAVEQEEFTQYFPHPGWVEHDANEIWAKQLAVMQAVVAKTHVQAEEIAGIGITNQRETVFVWDKATGRPVHRAIVWQCRRTADVCERMRAEGYEEMIRAKTGLVLDPYFSATKLAWILNANTDLRARAERGEVLFGTADSWLLWNLTGGQVHATDVSNASRTMLFNIHTMTWDEELLALFQIPRMMLPQVLPSSGLFGQTVPGLVDARLDSVGMGARADAGAVTGAGAVAGADREGLGARGCDATAMTATTAAAGAAGAVRTPVSVPVTSMIGDQQAALFGNCAFEIGSAKNTYGTGLFMLMNTGAQPVTSQRGLLTTVAWQLAGAEPVYALEGSVFTGGSVIQWLRDGLAVLDTAAESERYAREVDDTAGVYFVPAFTGLGTPYWRPEARGMLTGLTRGTTRAHIVRAALEAIAYQTADVLEVMAAESGAALQVLAVDGGATANNWLMQFQADLLGAVVDRPQVLETTALGAAYLAGLGSGFWASPSDLAQLRHTDRSFLPGQSDAWRAQRYAGWQRAVAYQL